MRVSGHSATTSCAFSGAEGLPPLTLIHGIGGRPAHVLPIAAALGADEGAAAPALPGHHDVGASAPSAGAPVPSVGASAADAARADDERLPRDVSGTAAWLRERAPVAGRLLVGHSTGGVLALALAARRVGERGGPVQGDARGVGPAGVVVVDSNVPVAPDAVAARAAKAGLARRPDWRAAMRDSLARDWRGPECWRRRVFADLDATPDEPMRSLWESVLTVDTRALWAGLRPGPGGRLSVLYLRSTRDVAEADVAPVLAPGVELTVARVGAGHWPHLQDPEGVAEAIRRWWVDG